MDWTLPQEEEEQEGEEQADLMEKWEAIQGNFRKFHHSNNSLPLDPKKRSLLYVYWERLPLPAFLKPQKSPIPEEYTLETPMPKIPFTSSIQMKFAMSSLSILVAVLFLLNRYPISATHELLFQSKRTSLERQIQMISSALMELENLSATTVERVVTTLETSGLSRIVVTDPRGEILYDSSRTVQLSGDYALTQEIYLALLGNNVENMTVFTTHILATASAPIVYGDNTIGAIYLQESDFVQGQLLTSLRDNLRTISLTSAAGAALLYVIFSVFLTNRIRAMLAAIRIVGEGDYGHRLLPKGNDEMSYLAMEFNILTDRLQTTEEVRRRFVSDASHELRTPLASIRLLADSILHNETMNPDMTREFVSDICTESERLSRITERLLSLSKLDSLPAPVAEPVEIRKVVERILQNLELVAEEAQVELRYDPQDHYLLCTTDKLHQICYNLMENAVKYTPAGGYTKLSTRVSENEILIEVEDNGLGIPPEDLPKIFNRFYRVDDARSREAGGTGLGLAIVRDTVRAYGGWVEAKNSSPHGTIFTVGLPKAKDMPSLNVEEAQEPPQMIQSTENEQEENL